MTLNIVGQRVRLARENAAIPLDEDALARRVGEISDIEMSPARLRAIEARECTVEDREVDALARALGVSVGWLFDDPGPDLAHPGDPASRQQNAVFLLDELVAANRRMMARWTGLTAQSPQIDSGYIGQHLVSALTGTSGVYRRGKGLDLEDGSEVKAACKLDCSDKPRWNHSFPRSEEAAKRAERIAKWLKIPAAYYVLFEELGEQDMPYPAPEGIAPGMLQVRVWMVRPTKDFEYRAVFERWRDAPVGTNLQLHPPDWHDNVATNECGDLVMPLMFSAQTNRNGHFRVVDQHDPAVLPSCVAQQHGQQKRKRAKDRAARQRDRRGELKLGL
jgi:transcriptional regulator with XRE-family HTH domain